MMVKEKPITKAELDELAAQIESDRMELNSISSSLSLIHEDVVQMSQQLDEKILSYTKMHMQLQKQQKPSAN